MTRSQRIRLVMALGVCAFALLVAFVGAPLVAASFWPSPDLSDDVGGFVESMSSVQQIANATNLVSLGSLAVAAICFIYVLVVLAVRFLVSTQNSSDHAA